MKIPDEYQPRKVVAEKLGIIPTNLSNWAKNGVVRTIKPWGSDFKVTLYNLEDAAKYLGIDIK